MKVLAYRIRDFRSIKDSGVCTLSGDNITVLAGQNEAGKSAVLMALRDFDLTEGMQPETPEFRPEGNHEASPQVSVCFEVDPDEINIDLLQSKFSLPAPVHAYLKEKRKLWITRDLLTGKFHLDDEVSGLWNQGAQPKESPQPDSSTNQTQTTEKLPLLPQEQIGDQFHRLWPNFVFFDDFEHQLPRQIAVEPLQAAILAKKQGKSLPQPLPGQASVEDFLLLADIDLERVVKNKEQDKFLGNYLKGRTTTITGDFLTYWKQSVDGKKQVELQVKYHRNAQGILQFAFYVHDGVDQFPEQRSRGFLWFLSFFLRLAAQEKRAPNSDRLLLIDEPGTHLHAKAQRDVLHLIEDKLATKQQVIYSTHSPYLLPTEKLHRLRVVLRHGKEGTIIADRLTHPALRGEGFSDTLSPIIAAIGIDIRERLGGLSKCNLLAEGLSDHTYLTAWVAHLKSPLHGTVCIFPGTGAGSLPTLGSLCIGWGLDFTVLLDRDAEGEKTTKKFERDLGLVPARIIRPSNAVTIEDVFDKDDFKMLLAKLDPSLTIDVHETPSQAIKRQNIDKVLLARRFAESPAAFTRSSQSFSRLLQTIEKSFGL